MKCYSRLSAGIGLCLALVPAASAHHSQSEYDLRAKLEVEGTVTKVEWRSPHAWIYVDVVSDKGETVNWSFELPSPVTLMRRGWTRDSLKIGDQVVVEGARARDNSYKGNASSVVMADGKRLFNGAAEENEGKY